MCGVGGEGFVKLQVNTILFRNSDGSRRIEVVESVQLRDVGCTAGIESVR